MDQPRRSVSSLSADGSLETLGASTAGVVTAGAVVLMALGCGARTDVKVEELEPCLVDVDCNDRLMCNGREQCIEGRCRRGEAPDCDDDDPCTEDRCAEPGGGGGDGAAAGCVHERINDVDEDGDGYLLAGTCGNDCDDTDPAVHPGADELCNGVDDDCDGAIDEGASFAPEGRDLRVTRDPEVDGRGSVVWSPLTETWGVTYWEYRGGTGDTWFVQLAEDGTRVEEPRLLTPEPGDAFGTSTVWSGSEYGVAWEDRRDGTWEVYFNRLTPDGAKLAPDYRVTSEPAWSVLPSLLWTGEEYVVAWQDWRHQVERPDNFEIYMTFLDSRGYEIGDDIRLTHDPASSESPTMALGDDEIGLAFVDDRTGTQQVWWTATDLTGARRAVDVRLSDAPGPAHHPAIAWIDGAFLVAWQEEGPDGQFDLYGARIPRGGEAGAVEGPIPLVVGPAWTRAPDLLGNGEEVLISFGDDRAGSYDLYVTAFDTRLERLREDVRVTAARAASVFGALSRGSQSIGILFEDQRDDNWEVYFTRLLCAGVEADADAETGETAP